MTPQALVESLGINVVFLEEDLGIYNSLDFKRAIPNRYIPLGSKAIAFAHLVLDRDTDRVMVFSHRYHAAHDLLHEGCHALCGTSSLIHEGALWFLQWQLMQRLDQESHQQVMDHMKQHYRISPRSGVSNSIRDFPTVFRKNTAFLRDQAHHQGLVTSQDEVLAYGPHPSWTE